MEEDVGFAAEAESTSRRRGSHYKCQQWTERGGGKQRYQWRSGRSCSTRGDEENGSGPIWDRQLPRYRSNTFTLQRQLLRYLGWEKVHCHSMTGRYEDWKRCLPWRPIWSSSIKNEFLNVNFFSEDFWWSHLIFSMSSFKTKQAQIHSIFLYSLKNKILQYHVFYICIQSSTFSICPSNVRLDYWICAWINVPSVLESLRSSI